MRQHGLQRNKGSGRKHQKREDSDKNKYAPIPKIAYTDVESLWREIPPGHRFLMYAKNFDPETGGKLKNKLSTLKKISEPISESSWKSIAEALNKRQKELVKSKNCLHVKTTAIAPFTTGLGEAHALENGFSFLSPYGIPYYPASGIKGVVRQAAEILALKGRGKWSMPLVWWLFGFDAACACLNDSGEWSEAFKSHMQNLSGDAESLLDAFLELYNSTLELKGKDRVTKDDIKELKKKFTDRVKEFHLRGSLTFLDCFPIPPEDSLRIEIMNPHHAGYYQGKNPPHTAENPIPIYFLTLPPGTIFNYYVLFTPVESLPKKVAEIWYSAMDEALRFAFTELGAGAKTAVGYGVQEAESVHIY